MIQVVVGRAALRSFTPLYWDAEQGVTNFLVYVHGDSSTSRWVKGIETGAVCYVLGPRRCVALNDVAGGNYFFGNESSFALAKSLSTTQGGKNTRYVFEVGSLSEASAVAEGLDLPRAILLEREAGGAHLAEIEEELAYLIRISHRRFVFSGQAASVERLSQFLRRCGVSLEQRRMAIHWSAGKVWLD